MNPSIRPPWVHLGFALLVLGLIYLLTSCGSATADPVRGSAVELSVDRNARAIATTNAADKATVDAASKVAKATALEKIAKEQATQANIDAAVSARVDAASALAVANALTDLSIKADKQAKDASEDARKEREASDKAKDDRRWIFICRCVGLGGIVIGGLLGLILGKFASPSAGLWVGGGIAAIAMAVVAFGATITWLPLVLATAVVIGFGIWYWNHHQHDQQRRTLSEEIEFYKAQIAALKSKVETEVHRVTDDVLRHEPGNSG